MQDASGGVIITEGAFATIEKCYIKNSFMIGLLHSIGRLAYVAEQFLLHGTEVKIFGSLNLY